MVKGGIKALLVTILAVSLVLPFSISSFADPYLGTEYIVNSDGTVILKNNNPSGQTFSSGSNIQYNVWNNNPVIDDNTFNGSTSITNTFNQLTSADNNFTGNTTLQVIDGGGNIESNLDTFNTMTVAAAGTNLNFNDSTFQGAVNINDAGVVQIGSTTESAQIVTNTSNTVTQLQTTNTRLNSIITKFDTFIANFLLYIELIMSDTQTSDGNGNAAPALTYSKTFGSVTVSYPVAQNAINVVTFNSNSHSLNIVTWRYRRSLKKTISENIGILSNNIYNLFLYAVWNINNNFNTWWSAYLPNKSLAQAQYWIAYNTDTDSYDSVNLATVFGYMTWYLGQMYIQGNEAAADISDSVYDMSSAFTDLESKENQINSSIKNSLNNVDSFFNLPAIASGSVVIGWLQYMWVSLGMFQGVTIISWALIILTIVTGFYKVKRITV